MVGSTSRWSLDFSSFSRLGWWWVHMSKHVQAKFGHLRMYVFHPQPWETRGSHLPTHRKPILKCPHVWRTLWETLLPGLLPRFFHFEHLKTIWLIFCWGVIHAGRDGFRFRHRRLWWGWVSWNVASIGAVLTGAARFPSVTSGTKCKNNTPQVVLCHLICTACHSYPVPISKLLGGSSRTAVPLVFCFIYPVFQALGVELLLVMLRTHAAYSYIDYIYIASRQKNQTDRNMFPGCSRWYVLSMFRCPAFIYCGPLLYFLLPQLITWLADGPAHWDRYWNWFDLVLAAAGIADLTIQFITASSAMVVEEPKRGWQVSVMSVMAQELFNPIPDKACTRNHGWGDLA